MSEETKNRNGFPINDFEDLVDAWGKNSDKVFINAYRESIRRSPNVPEGVKDLLCGKDESNAGLIARHWQLIQSIIGNIELAHRRGEQVGDIIL